MTCFTALATPLRVIVLAGLCGVCLSHLAADEVTLKNGTRFEGRSTPLFGLGTGPRGGKNRGPTTVYNVTMVDTGLARYFVPRTQVAEFVADQMGGQNQVFKLPQHGRSGAVAIQQIGRFLKVTPFDEWGRRQITINAGGKERVVIQAITEISPDYLKLEGMNHRWDSGMATSSLPRKTLAALLEKATKPDDPDHRMAIVRFYLQAQMYRDAKQELVAIEKDFPEFADNVKDVRLQLTQMQAKQLLDELSLRRAAGQHQLVYQSTLKFPSEDVSRSILRDVTEMTADYENKKQQRELFVTKIHELPNDLSNKDHAEAVNKLADSLIAEFNISTMDRLESFFLYAKDGGLPADEQLALAISGMVVGSSYAETDLDRALRLWKARELVMEYLAVLPAEAYRRQEILVELDELEGIDAASIARILPLLPSAVKTPQAVVGAPFEVALPAQEEEPAVNYTVILPPEYHPGQNYPMIVALREQGKTTQQEAEWWAGTAERAGQAQRHGYIVIAPEYAATGAFAHTYSSDSHHSVVEAIYDACRRFQVDSDRIFLSGHGMGGDAAFDIGLSHPDMFAGVIPICGVIRNNCQFYWSNAEHLPLYVIGGELDRDVPNENSGVLMRMMMQGYDLIYVEYIGRGREGFYEEIHKLFTWMALQTRPRTLRDYEMKTMRETDGRFYWFEAQGLPSTISVTDWTNRRRRGKRAMPLKVHISPGNTISISSGAERNTVWLSPDIVDFDSRLRVNMKNRMRYNDFPEADLETMLEDYRRRGDRQQIFWTRLDF
ncbi:Alpha/beta hydrolase family protein [Symmachiella dynata]|uniref:Alpha/beta hydrolase family protein n=1 Tax=Symmachiella dynata TaxID=2527995 RepID=A0A517ZWA3_9PLAN|nr:PHB depolymerase family esterase [Symmachiella dynata]QDU46705.1 Alpha/beta hydrolase family protein [Symmachiella dynata]